MFSLSRVPDRQSGNDQHSQQRNSEGYPVSPCGGQDADKGGEGDADFQGGAHGQCCRLCLQGHASFSAPGANDAKSSCYCPSASLSGSLTAVQGCRSSPSFASARETGAHN